MPARATCTWGLRVFTSGGGVRPAPADSSCTSHVTCTLPAQMWFNSAGSSETPLTPPLAGMPQRGFVRARSGKLHFTASRTCFAQTAVHPSPLAQAPPRQRSADLLTRGSLEPCRLNSTLALRRAFAAKVSFACAGSNKTPLRQPSAGLLYRDFDRARSGELHFAFNRACFAPGAVHSSPLAQAPRRTLSASGPKRTMLERARVKRMWPASPNLARTAEQIQVRSS